MKLNKIRFIEKFILVTFPVALAVGCTTTTEPQAKASSAEKTALTQSYETASSQNLETTKTQVKLFDTKTPGDAMNIQTGTTDAQSKNATVKAANTVYSDDSLEVKVRLSGSNDVQKPAKTIFQFAVNKYDLDGSELEVIKQHANYLKTHSNLILHVDGFSDNRGSALGNYKLSKKRAQQVADLLKSYGAPQSQIKVNGYGESFPLNHEKNWDENRRVELEYIDSSPASEMYASYK